MTRYFFDETDTHDRDGLEQPGLMPSGLTPTRWLASSAIALARMAARASFSSNGADIAASCASAACWCRESGAMVIVTGVIASHAAVVDDLAGVEGGELLRERDG